MAPQKRSFIILNICNDNWLGRISFRLIYKFDLYRYWIIQLAVIHHIYIYAWVLTIVNHIQRILFINNK